jgi:signal transduction histidine kinase
MRRRIVAVALAASMLAITVFGVPLAAAVAAYTIKYGEGELERDADTVALAVAADLFDGHPVGRLPETSEAAAISVYGMAGTRLAGDGPNPGGLFVSDSLEGHTHAGEDADELVVTIPVTHDGDVIGVVRAARPLTSVHRQIGLLWLAMAGLGVAAILVVALLARHQARRLARPLEEIADVARAMGEGEFSLRNPHARVAEIDAVGSALNLAAERLDDMLARERSFSADASHQLRTPLAGLRLRLEAALDRPDQDLDATLRGAVRDTERLERTISELLTLARDRGDVHSPLRLDLSGLLQELELAWSPRLALEGRAFRVVEEEAPQAPAAASTAAVRQLLNVLVDNATVHGEGTVAVTVRETAGALAIDVSDDGSPITLTDDALFNRLGQSADGHGIGLSLARRLAEAEGGRLRLSCAAPPTFTLLLPALAPAPDHVTRDGQLGASDTSSR